MAKTKSDHPLVGKIFTAKGQVYRVQDVQQQIIHASKMIDDTTCQRGRPSKFELHEVMSLLGVTTQSLATEAAATAAKAVRGRPKLDKIEEPLPPPVAAPLTAEELEAKSRAIATLIAMFPPDDNW